MSERDDNQRSGQQNAGSEPKGRSIAEWTSLAISLSILATLIGLMTYHYLTTNTKLAIIEVQPKFDEVRRQDDRFYLPVQVRNQGGEPTGDVHVELSLEAENETISSDFTISFLDAGQTADAVVVFSAEPVPERTSVTAITYLLP